MNDISSHEYPMLSKQEGDGLNVLSASHSVLKNGLKKISYAIDMETPQPKMQTTMSTKVQESIGIETPGWSLHLPH